LPDHHEDSKRESETRTLHRNPVEVPQSHDRWSTDVSDECCQEALVPEVGDQIQVMGTKVDQATRSGVVTDVRGRMVTVQWAAGDQSVFVPAPGTLTVLGRADARRRRTNDSARASRTGQGAIPARPSTTKKAARKAPVRKTATKGMAKKAARKAPVRKTATTAVAKKAARNRVR
jgi:hypothetical protein